MISVTKSLLSNRRWIILFIIISIFLAISAYKLDLRVVMDEPWLCAPGYSLITQGRFAIPQYRDSSGGHDKFFLAFPLQQLLLAGVFKIFGLGIIQARALSVFFGALVVVFTYLLAKHLFDEKIAQIQKNLKK